MEQQYIKQLENNLHSLIEILTNVSLWNFLSDSEREAVSKVLSQSAQQS
jgi:hypothetical protein